MAHVLGPTLLCRGLESCGFYSPGRKDAEREYTRIQAAHRDFLSDPSLSSTLHFTLLSQSTIFSGGVDRDIYESGFFGLPPHSRSISSLFLRCGVLHTKGLDEVRIIAWTTKMSDWTILRTILKRYLTAWHGEAQNLPWVTLVTDPAYASDNTLAGLLHPISFKPSSAWLGLAWHGMTL